MELQIQSTNRKSKHANIRKMKSLYYMKNYDFKTIVILLVLHHDIEKSLPSNRYIKQKPSSSIHIDQKYLFHEMISSLIALRISFIYAMDLLLKQKLVPSKSSCKTTNKNKIVKRNGLSPRVYLAL